MRSHCSRLSTVPRHSIRRRPSTMVASFAIVSAMGVDRRSVLSEIFGPSQILDRVRFALRVEL